MTRGLHTLILLSALAAVAVGCATSEPSPPEKIRSIFCAIQGDPTNFCSSACDAAQTNCSDLFDAIESTTFGPCISACPSSPRCTGGSITINYYDCNCFADCLARESAVEQQRIAAANECDTPAPCRAP